MLIKTEKPEVSENDIQDNLKNPGWRLSNLYKILDIHGNKVTFRPNPWQVDFFGNMHNRNLILKARQLGFTTAIDIFLLDRCLFTPGTTACIVAQKTSIAKRIFSSKIQYPYINLPPALREMVKPETQNKTELEFTNDSFLAVDTTWRGGTLNLLHISEYGKICATDPAHQQELITGTLNAVAPIPTNMIAIESTAEGQNGHFWDLCSRSWDKDPDNLTTMDWKFFFYPWWLDKKYRLEQEVAVPNELKEYFTKLENEHGVKLTSPQKYWYVKTEEDQGEDMRREFPSFKEESFHQAVEGAFFGRQMSKIEKAGQITKVPYDPSLPVHTFWDLGMSDFTSIWFYQNVRGRHNFIDFYENHDEDPAHYARILQDRGYRYGWHYFPHDGGNKTMLGSIRDQFQQLGVSPIRVNPRVPFKMTAIDKARMVLPTCWFDEARCATGLQRLRSYRKRVKADGEIQHDKEAETDANHAADAFMEFAMGWTGTTGSKPIQYRNLKRYA